MVAWPNGKALDYESRDCRFDPCRDHICFVFCMFKTMQFFKIEIFFFLLARKHNDKSVRLGEPCVLTNAKMEARNRLLHLPRPRHRLRSRFGKR